ncbi:hypothetical protein [Larkinella rosea]|uniref:hypothetical protein n=1 Tax=Larkinella rosea TaxID=2025312 RepID=UPI000F5E8D31|nr:hypothetical protein [Larkinella rosea]
MNRLSPVILISLAFAPINTSKHLFLIGGGAGMQYKAYSQYWAYNPDRYFVESRRRIGASFNAMFGYDYRLNRQISLGIRQNYVIDGDVIPMLTIGAGIRI